MRGLATVTLKIKHIMCRFLPENEVCHGVSLCSCAYNTFCTTIPSQTEVLTCEDEGFKRNLEWNQNTSQDQNRETLIVIIGDLPVQWRQLLLQNF